VEIKLTHYQKTSWVDFWIFSLKLAFNS
jgi:hypothetical protein